MATFPIQTDCSVSETDAFKASSDCAKDILSCMQCICDALDDQVVYSDIEIKQTVKEIYSKARRAYTFCRKILDGIEDDLYSTLANAIADTGATITAIQAALMYESVQMRDLYTSYADKSAEPSDLRPVTIPNENQIEQPRAPEPIPAPASPTVSARATLPDGTELPIVVNLYLTVHVNMPGAQPPAQPAQEPLPLSGLSSGRGGEESVPLSGGVSTDETFDIITDDFEIPLDSGV